MANLSPAAFQYAKLYRKLQCLIDGGKGESQEAEDIADQMDRPWHDMTPTEQEAWRKSCMAPKGKA